MNEARPSPTRWRKSRHSNSQAGECVEVAGLSDAVAVRDSKDLGGPVLPLHAATWRSLLRDIKNS
ncbi:DUF397 domain-containing protein [Actinomadura rugatobispora]|uniref:DUF397 domain-containing protein n=1 Tax=Actinomadura rugatobispora TaxID=1994 RepID=A0ABW0ZYS1_9ACTN|nr:hypothetical protein GCM10010200_076310 [Actinomadura rugatobispora]